LYIQDHEIATLTVFEPDPSELWFKNGRKMDIVDTFKPLPLLYTSNGPGVGRKRRSEAVEQRRWTTVAVEANSYITNRQIDAK
jgi:hypothetical protein